MKMTVREIVKDEIEHASDDPQILLRKEILNEYKKFRTDSCEGVLPKEKIRKSYIRHVMKLFDGNVTHTANTLKISKNTLKKRLSG